MARQREVRLGLVLYGGVSLAVYENGVAQELHRMVCGQGVYGLLCELTDSDIVVDIISGTSAGGVNGVMLAYALANKRKFAASADLWRNEGDIERLLRKQNDPDAQSVLDSDYYQNRLQNCFANELTQDNTGPQIEELDLFVTSTDANGAISTVYDDLGHAIDIKNHRALFQLSYRGERKNDFGAPPSALPALAKDLAQLCRMTSCFPVAFEPVRVDTSQTNFFRWGRLRNPAVYLDGGILNNKPFTSTIDAIARRTANRAVERFLIYVEPNPERFAPSAEVPNSPAIAQAAAAALISIPSYQSIAGDLDAIEAHNQRASQIAEIVQWLGDAKKADPSCLDSTGVLAAANSDCDSTAYYGARLIEIRDAAVEAILNDKEGRGYFQPCQETPSGQRGTQGSSSGSAKAMDERRSGRILVQSFDHWRGNPAVTLKRYDVLYRLRRAGHLTNTLMRRAKKNTEIPPEPSGLSELSQLWDIINHFFKVYEIAQWAMVNWLTKEDFGWRSLSDDYPDLDTQPQAVQNNTLANISTTIWGKVETYLDRLMLADLPVPTDPTPEARQEFYEKLRNFDGNPAPVRSGNANLLDLIDTELKNALRRLLESTNKPYTAKLAAELCSEFCRFLEVDRQLFPILFGSEFMSTDVIRVVRFSPLDAQRYLSKGPVENKVRGVALSAFGGFFKKSWRANDIMVGRLDAACQLVECLLTEERLAAMAHSGRTKPLTLEDIQQCWRKEDRGEGLDAAAAAYLSTEINKYLAVADNPPPGAWDSLVNAIVEVAQNEIYREEFPRVVKCAIEQEYDWGQYDVTVPSPASGAPPTHPKPVWYRAKRKPDEVIVQAAADAIATGPFPPTPPGLKEYGAFVDEIPESVLQELGALAAIRLGKGLLASIPDQDKSKKLAGKLVFKVPFRWIAPIIYRFARSRRLQPSSIVVVNTAIAAFCITLLAAAMVLFVTGWATTATPLAIVVIAALLLFAAWARWFK
jgi:patatin-related protein